MRLVRDSRLVIYPPPPGTGAQLPPSRTCRPFGHVGIKHHVFFPLSLIHQHSAPISHNGQTSFRTPTRAGVGIRRRRVPPFPVRLHQPRRRLLGLLLPRLGRHGDPAAIRRPKLCPVCRASPLPYTYPFRQLTPSPPPPTVHPLDVLPPRPHRRRHPRPQALRQHQAQRQIRVRPNPRQEVQTLYPHPARLGAPARAPDAARLGQRHGLRHDAIRAPHQRRAGGVAVAARGRGQGRGEGHVLPAL